ncbi:MAG: lipoprotein insertase outer membrane protein LolB [Pseudomonadota bacterium]|nr:outer membrane lipoprotein LolB [Gammaproteobacteria bacterium]MEE2684064.1 lipoprotein insertase outer membrane protein LolB [Pseudomonadota bacterium]
MKNYLILCCMFIASCMTMKSIDYNNKILERDTYFSSLDSWLITGRSYIKNEEFDVQSNFVWRYASDETELHLYGPFGINAIKLSASDKGIFINQNNNITSIDKNNHASQSILSWGKAYKSFNYWLLGLEDPNYPSKTIISEDGTISELNQRFWLVSYESYQWAGKVLIPKEIVLINDDFEIRIRVDSWRT